MEHYNRGLEDKVDDAKKAYTKHLKDTTTALDKLLEGEPTKEDCKKALEKLGNLSHSWQDYYAHAVRKSSPYGGDPGKISGTPDSQGSPMKPSSWGHLGIDVWNNDFGEHGRNEPASRRKDKGKEREKQAIEFVAGKYEEIMKKWAEKCSCHYNKLGKTK